MAAFHYHIIELSNYHIGLIPILFTAVTKQVLVCPLIINFAALLP
jgi:hypothetical protein